MDVIDIKTFIPSKNSSKNSDQLLRKPTFSVSLSRLCKIHTKERLQVALRTLLLSVLDKAATFRGIYIFSVLKEFNIHRHTTHKKRRRLAALGQKAADN